MPPQGHHSTFVVMELGISIMKLELAGESQLSVVSHSFSRQPLRYL